MTVDVLGTKYDILYQSDKDNPKMVDCNGLCETESKKIIIDVPTDDVMTLENVEQFQRKVLRHEIIHAFLQESGLGSNSEWARNEEMVDWFALQYRKLKQAFEEADCY